MNALTIEDVRPCHVCGKGILHTGVPLCYRVRIERMGFNRSAIGQILGMEAMFGGHAEIARAMSPVRDIADPIGEPREILICEQCALEPIQCLAALAYQE